MSFCKSTEWHFFVRTEMYSLYLEAILEKNYR